MCVCVGGMMEGGSSGKGTMQKYHTYIKLNPEVEIHIHSELPFCCFRGPHCKIMLKDYQEAVEGRFGVQET